MCGREATSGFKMANVSCSFFGSALSENERLCIYLITENVGFTAISVALVKHLKNEATILYQGETSGKNIYATPYVLYAPNSFLPIDIEKLNRPSVYFTI